MKKLLFILLCALPLLAGNLNLKSGSITAHTEMMMDSEINPSSKNLSAELTMQGNDITSLSGKFWIDLKSFISDNADRDEHMQESLKSSEFKLATYTVRSISKADGDDAYLVNGVLNFHGQEKELTANAKITSNDAGISFTANSMMMMPEYGIEMPCMVFMCVRDRVDLLIKAELTH